MKTKNILFLLAICILCFWGCSQKNKEARYTISGSIQHSGNQKLILQELMLEGGASVTLDTITLKEDGKFSFSFLAKKEGLYRIAIQNEIDNGFEILVINDEKNIQVNADPNNYESFIIKGSKWFTANYNEVVEVLKLVKKDYNKFVIKSKSLKVQNNRDFSLNSMTEEFKKILLPYITVPEQVKLVLPKLNKVK